jgi:hypothetical protein
MKRVLVVALLVVVVMLALAAPAFAEEAHCESGQAFGQHNAEMPQAGMINGEHNPGMHQGYSTACTTSSIAVPLSPAK